MIKSEAVLMKRYIIEMSNDFEKRYPTKAIQIIKVRNAYISGTITELEAIKAIIKESEEISDDD